MLNMGYEFYTEDCVDYVKLGNNIICLTDVSKHNYYLDAIKTLKSVKGNKTFVDYYNEFKNCNSKCNSEYYYIVKLVADFKGINLNDKPLTSFKYNKQANDEDKMNNNIYSILQKNLNIQSGSDSYNPRRFNFGGENSRKGSNWIDIFSAINKKMNCFNDENTPFNEFIDNYKKFVSLFEYDKPYTFYSRSIYEVCEAVCIYLCKEKEDYDKVILEIRKNIELIDTKVKDFDENITFNTSVVKQLISHLIKIQESEISELIYFFVEAFDSLNLNENKVFVTKFIDEKIMGNFIDEVVLINKDAALDILIDFFTILYLKEALEKKEHAFFSKQYEYFFFSTISQVLNSTYNTDMKENVFDIINNEVFKSYIGNNMSYEEKRKKKNLDELYRNLYNLLDGNQEVYDGIVSEYGLDSERTNAQKIKKIFIIMRFIFALNLLDKYKTDSNKSNILNYKEINSKMLENNLLPLKEYKDSKVMRGLELDYLIYNYCKTNNYTIIHSNEPDGDNYEMQQ